MRVSRRHVALLLPALAAATATPKKLRAQTPAASPPAPRQKLGATKMYPHASMPYAGDAKKKARRFFIGETHDGFNLEVHETILGPGTETHAPHKHIHEEIIVIVEGTVESYVEGRTEVLQAGSVMWMGSNQMHSARNVGKVPSRYYVIELRGDEA
jgi:quercetin dioxygenase-like cupin family protein